MKKKLTVMISVMVAALCFGGCGEQAEGKKALYFAGDLQALYGEGGYPQAVLVVKNSFAEEYAGWVNGFCEELASSGEWLKTADKNTLFEAVRSHLPEDTAPSFQESVLTEGVVSRLGIRFAYAADSKAEIDGFLNELIEVNPSAASTVSESFYYEPKADAESVVPSKADVYMPDGAPALALAKFLAEDVQGDGIDYHVADATVIQTFVTGERAADLCVLPVNLASKLLGNGENYRCLGVVTHGNLYLLSKSETTFKKDNLGELKGKKVGVVSLPNVPGLTMKAVLNRSGIPWQDLTNGGETAADKVNLQPVSAELVTPVSETDFFLVAEPLASTRVGAGK